MSLTMSDDIYEIGSKKLERFIADNVLADSLFLGCCGEVIDKLVRNLQDAYTPGKLRPRRIIKSGSLGKGTAVKSRADVDLILMLAEYNDVHYLLGDLAVLLKQLERYLASKTTTRHLRTTNYSVQVEVTCTAGHKHDVDILPAVDLLQLGCSPADVYKKMKSVSLNIVHEYSVSLSPLQLEIIGALPTKVKNLIKLVKYWKDKKLKRNNTLKVLPISSLIKVCSISNCTLTLTDLPVEYQRLGKLGSYEWDYFQRSIRSQQRILNRKESVQFFTKQRHGRQERDEPEMPSFADKRRTKPNWPSSYVLELVVINAWTEAKGPTNFDMVRALHAVLTSLVNHRKFKVVFYRQMKYSQGMLKLRSPPFIMDPTNPFNDMYHGLVGGEAYDWDSVVPEARRWLGKALFQGVSGTENKW